MQRKKSSNNGINLIKIVIQEAFLKRTMEAKEVCVCQAVCVMSSAVTITSGLMKFTRYPRSRIMSSCMMPMQLACVWKIVVNLFSACRAKNKPEDQFSL